MHHSSCSHLAHQSSHFAQLKLMDLFIFIGIQLIEFPIQNGFIGWRSVARGMCSTEFGVEAFQEITVEQTLIVATTNPISIPCPMTNTVRWRRRRSPDIHFANFRTNGFATGGCGVRNRFSRNIRTPTTSTAHTLHRSVCTIRTASGHELFMVGRSMCYRIRTSFQTLCIRIIC